MACTTALHIGIVAGEASGDILGADLMRALRAAAEQRGLTLRFDGVGGPRMIAAGFDSLYPMERLSVMGLIDPLKRLPELLRMRGSLRRHFLAAWPDVFIGIDSPDFTLNLERSLREQGITTVHYVSPSVWAWRRGRIKIIRRAVDLMLTLLPFEADFYIEHDVPVTFVGHPLADQIPLEDQREAARAALGIDRDALLLALLPGSRGGEVAQLAPHFLDTFEQLRREFPNLQGLIPAASDDRRRQLESLLAGRSAPPRLVDGQSQQVMAAADAVLMASGTTTLEALLLKRPMVVAYRMGAISYRLLSPLVKTPYISLPNLLAGEALVPEVIQDDVRAEILTPLVAECLRGGPAIQALQERFAALHGQLALKASETAAAAILLRLERAHG